MAAVGLLVTAAGAAVLFGISHVYQGPLAIVLRDRRAMTATVHELFGEAIGVATRLVGAHGDERLHAIVGGGDARERGVGQLAWRERPRGNRRRKLGDALSMQVIAACHRRPVCSRNRADWQSARAAFDNAWPDGKLEVNDSPLP